MQLIHPIYLDVPMLVSFAAALQGGLSFNSEITEEEGKTSSNDSSSSAKLGVSNLFSSLFEASLAADSAQSKKDESTKIRRESKSHTESSVAILLYDELSKNDNYLVQPKTLDDIQSLHPGSLIEVPGVIRKNAVDAVIDYADAVSILSRLDTSQPKNKKKELNDPVKNLRAALDEDRKRTPISNVHLECIEPEGLQVLITLRTENLRDLTLSELHKNSVRVVGKVTRIVEKDETVSSFENYGMGLMEPNMLKDIFSEISSTEEMVTDFSPVQIKGPAVQVLPLMIFV